MMDYLERQIILDHHWRGEQDIFESEYPHLKETAEKLLGPDTYFDCSALTGTPLTQDEQPEIYARLLEIQNNLCCDLDQNLEKHNVKIDKFEEDIGATNESPLNQDDDENDQAPILTTEDSVRNIEPEAAEEKQTQPAEEETEEESSSKKAKDSG